MTYRLCEDSSEVVFDNEKRWEGSTWFGDGTIVLLEGLNYPKIKINTLRDTKSSES